MYLQEGGVKLSVVSEIGKEAVVAILGAGDFFGEGSLAGQSVRMGTATAITPSTVLVIEKSAGAIRCLKMYLSGWVSVLRLETSSWKLAIRAHVFALADFPHGRNTLDSLPHCAV